MKGEPAEQLLAQLREQGDHGILLLTVHAADLAELAGEVVEMVNAAAAVARSHHAKCGMEPSTDCGARIAEEILATFDDVSTPAAAAELLVGCARFARLGATT